ncbi:MAG TPA: DUF6111 family protein [Azospirillum sp.]|nr:DUF6111 family protein [Azospirillum sp.]
MRLFLTIILPLVAPTLLYLSYVVVVEGRRVRAAEAGERAPWWAAAPWPWLVAAGVALLAVTLGTLALTGGSEPGTVYVPAHMENGRLVPGTTGK